MILLKRVWVIKGCDRILDREKVHAIKR